jgi:hypothetical protein
VRRGDFTRPCRPSDVRAWYTDCIAGRRLALSSGSLLLNTSLPTVMQVNEVLCFPGHCINNKFDAHKMKQHKPFGQRTRIASYVLLPIAPVAWWQPAHPGSNLVCGDVRIRGTPRGVLSREVGAMTAGIRGVLRAVLRREVGAGAVEIRGAPKPRRHVVARSCLEPGGGSRSYSDTWRLQRCPQIIHIG